MSNEAFQSIAPIAAHFPLEGKLVSAESWGNGHINRTIAATYRSSSSSRRYIFQRINHHVFRDPVGVMDNIDQVLRYLRTILAEQNTKDIERRVLTLILTAGHESSLVDDEGYHWRCYHFVERTRSYDVVPDTTIASRAALAFGDFQRLLQGFDASLLKETISAYHHTPTRYQQLLAAIESDTANRAAKVKDEISFALAREALTQPIAAAFARGTIPLRVTHNDTKVNNVLFDSETDEALCVVDLDTVMPGVALYDFGGLVRTACATAAEDELDLSLVGVDLTLYEALVKGYLQATSSFLVKDEIELLSLAGTVHTYEDGIRFLADYLRGDTYYKVHRPDHNLDRARTQFKMVEQMERLAPQMEALVNRYSSAV